ncbi:uncharacterized protein BKCO1_3900065 [Diplodia corticola]|uniref:F-box domain-containing protein n=1 Tax=Diplodia corticola TaxID=236234 RepID=A0A1J9QW87_9PEZI|nr:uncharacterized protein BKCO1_3900065 [Diplodia corticola]OJD32266.1 hypothetical protein BKCO1_3900065 [Diplodia corticola]
MNGCPIEPLKPFRLLDLPAELRLRIYEHALTAPDKAIRVYYSYEKNRINPALSLSLLRTCRQVYAEARDVLFQENTVFIHADVHRIGNPVIGASQLPPPALSSIRRLFVVVDIIDSSHASSYAHADFRPFQAMVRLRHLRIAAIDDAEPPPGREPARRQRGLEGCTRLLSCLIERVPATCKLEYAAASGPEKQFVAPWCNLSPNCILHEVTRDALMRAAAYSQAEQGCKSGSDADWRRDPAAANLADPLDQVRTW